MADSVSDRIAEIRERQEGWVEAIEDARADRDYLLTTLAERDRRIAELEAALKSICDLKPSEYQYPADWDQQIAGCSECQGWAKNHPIQRGICNKHRRPIWDAERHREDEAKAIGYRAKDAARAALHPAKGETG